jgi:hypothetical protein
MFTFDPIKHEYKLDGRTLPSATQALKGAGLIEFGGIRPEVLEAARVRGTNVHSAVQYFNEAQDFTWGSVDPAIAGYVRAWERCIKESGFVYEGGEAPMYHPVYEYAGTPDIIGKMNGLPMVIDIKTYESADWTALQLAAYQMMLIKQFGTHFDRCAVWLKPDGTYKFRRFSEANDAQVFLACLAITNWKANHGYKIAA